MTLYQEYLEDGGIANDCEKFGQWIEWNYYLDERTPEPEKIEIPADSMLELVDKITDIKQK